MFTKILIANRGEIACRVAATARRLGVRTVAVYSEADRDAQHVAACDEAVCVGGPAPKDSYLRGKAIIEAALKTGAQAVHPGYGFLSENEDFAEGCAKAGLVFIGPPAAAIRAMGSKSAAKALMEKAGVPLVPGYHGDEQEPALLKLEADRIGYPVLIKASAGGGGKGMRIVEKAEDFEMALASCQREAGNAFGDDRVLVEKYLLRPRHIEIQVFADRHGNCVYLFERDCSVQRRHQKVLEEAPAPGLRPERRQAMGEAAVAAARAVGYEGAGTVEFIADQQGDFFFMEMNTRLQVEHPVTEMITGHDLVEWQLRVAAGQPLPATQADLRIHGHAIEARVYAESPEKGFLPAIGRIDYLSRPAHVAFVRGAGGAAGEPAPVRVDSGVREGDAITPFYDPMIAKLIVWGADRTQALARMSQALAEFHVAGVRTNVAFLGRVVKSRPFVAADLDTGLIERHRDAVLPASYALPPEAVAVAVARLLADEAAAVDPDDPWGQRDGWRLNGVYQRHFTFRFEERKVEARVDYFHTGLHLGFEGYEGAFNYRAEGRAGLAVEMGTRAVRAAAVVQDEAVQVYLDGREVRLEIVDMLAHAGANLREEGRLTAPMPGKIVSILVTQGATVRKGAPLLIMEAMKMEHTISAPADGKVEALLYAVGDQVAEGAQLLGFKAG
jgi:3-methylcrotonyl-CoA carboxylase alpha subunit